MKLPNVASVALIVALITVVTTFIQTTYPGAMYVWAPLVVGILTVVGKWLQEYFIDQKEAQQPQVLPMPDNGMMMSPQPPAKPVKKPSMFRRVMLG